MGVRVKGLGVKVETMKIQLLEHVSEANYNHKNRIFSKQDSKELSPRLLENAPKTFNSKTL